MECIIFKWTSIWEKILWSRIAENFAWKTAGYYWSTNGLTSADKDTHVDDVTEVINRKADEEDKKDRRIAFKHVKKYLN